MALSTIVQNSLGAGVAGTGPAFGATSGSTQSISVATTVKLQFGTESFDTNNCYDTSNYRFTPTVAGYYQINITVSAQTTAAKYGLLAIIYKNGFNTVFGSTALAEQYNYPYSNASGLVYLNGSTDYVEAYVNAYGVSGSLTCVPNSFQGFLARSAT